MTARQSPWLAGLVLGIAANLHAVPVPAGDSATAFKPTVCLRLAPPDQILADIRYLADLVARFAPSEKEGKAFVAGVDTALDAALGPDWRKAADTARPLLAYGTLDANPTACTAVVLIPVKDQPAFEALLKRLVGKIDLSDEGILRFDLPDSGTPPTKAFARVANQYAYVTVFDSSVLARNRIPTPAQIVAGDPAAVASARLFLERVPNQYRQQALAGVEQFKALITGNAGGGGAPMGALGMQMFVFGAPLFQLYSLAEAAIRDGQELTLDVKFDRKRLNLSVDATLTAKAGSELSRLTAAIKPATSLFPQMIDSDLAARSNMRGTIPDDVRKGIIAFLEEGSKRMPQFDPVWGPFGAKLDESLIPTIRAGEVDFAVGLTGPTKDRYGIIAGARLADAAGVEKAFRDAVKALPKNDQALFKLDTATVAGVKVHQIPPRPEPLRPFFGEPNLYVAFGTDRVVVAFGDGGLGLLEKGLTAKQQPITQSYVEASGRKLVPLVTKIDAEVGKKFKALLGNDLDRIPIQEIAVEGGSALKVHYGNMLSSFVPLMGLYAFRVAEMRQAVPARAIVPAPPAAKPASPR